MICTEDEEFYPVGTTWNLYGCHVELLEVLSDERTIVCDIIVEGHTHYEEVLHDGATCTYGAYTVTCNMVFGTDEPLVQTIICTESEPTDVLTLYFKPWSWTNIDGALAFLSDDATGISGELSNAFSGISGYEYVSHEIVYEKPEGSSISLIGIKIYLYSDGTARLSGIAFPVPVIVYVVLVGLIAIFGGLMTPVAEAWGEIVGKAQMYPILIKKVEELDAEVVGLELENAELLIASGEMTPEQLVAWIDGLIARDSELNREFLAKNGRESHDKYAACLIDAKNQYLSDGDMDKCVDDVAACIDTRLDERKTETEENYDDDDLVNLDFDDLMDNLLKYAKYGLLALFGIMAVKAAID